MKKLMLIFVACIMLVGCGDKIVADNDDYIVYRSEFLIQDQDDEEHTLLTFNYNKVYDIQYVPTDEGFNVIFVIKKIKKGE